MENLFDLNAARLGSFNVLLREVKDKWHGRKLVKHSSSYASMKHESVKVMR